MRRLVFPDKMSVAFHGESRSVHYARHWLRQIGLQVQPEAERADSAVVLVAGDSASGRGGGGAATIIHLWDFQVGLSGGGLQACAAAGVSWVLGHPGRPPLSLPVDVPEKWCGLVAANLALASLLQADRFGQTPSVGAPGRRIDVSAADALRAFADQNAGDQAEVEGQWHRNGSVAVEHGGIYPQGFFPCRDGHVGVIGRSRKDWLAIREAIGRPAWSRDPKYDDPFALSRAPGDVDSLLRAELVKFDRDELLERAIELGATIAPVYQAAELAERNVVRSDFFDEAGFAGLPFRITR